MITEKRWYFKEKFNFGQSGAWANEPDKVQWVDEVSGYDCLIVRSTLTGALCGYVGVHPLFGVEVMDDSFPDLSVHGGVTFTGRCSKNDNKFGICHQAPCANEEVWWVGFDCAHFDDHCPDAMFSHIVDGGKYKTIDYVKREILSLAKQLKEVEE